MASLARCVIVVEDGAPCLVPLCRTNVPQIDIRPEAELIWSLQRTDCHSALSTTDGGGAERSGAGRFPRSSSVKWEF